MTKQKRKLYRIKKLRRQGLNYQERGKKIAEMKGSKIKKLDNHIIQPVKMVKKSWWQRVIDFIKSLWPRQKKQ